MYLHQILIITSPIEFNITLTYVDARLKQRCINVVTTLCNVASTLCNVVSTLFQHQALTLYQRCAMLKIRRRILFHFQHYFNVDPQGWNNVWSDFEMLAGKDKNRPHHRLLHCHISKGLIFYQKILQSEVKNVLRYKLSHGLFHCH